jgi:hypothetical protein
MKLNEPVRNGLAAFASQDERADGDNGDDDDEHGEGARFHGRHGNKALLNPG